MITVRDSIHRFMRETGMTTVFGNPGSTELPFFRDWPEDFDYVLGLQEAAVLSMADGYAQATGRCAMVNLHAAAGLGHALGSLVTAYKNQAPLIVMNGQQARPILPYDPFLGAVDAPLFPQPYVKWSVEAARAEDTPKAIARAYAIAMTPPRGPVFVSVPVDDWDKESEPLAVVDRYAAGLPGASVISDVCARLDGAARPVIVAGPEVDRSRGWDALVRLAEKMGCPVWASPMASRVCFPETHAQFAGFLPADENSVADRLSPFDVALVAGAPVFQYHFHAPAEKEFPAIIQLTNDPEIAGFTPSGVSIVCDTGAALEEIANGARQRPPFQGRARPDVEPAPSTGSLTTAEALDIIERLRPKAGAIIEEAPSARPQFQNRVRIDRPGGFYATASGGLGFATAAAVGVSLAEPDRRTICLVGDGSSLYTIQALWTAAQLRLNLTYIILNNTGYEALKSIARRMNAPAVGADLPGMDFISIAKGFGLSASRAETGSIFETQLEAALKANGPNLVEAVVDQ